jgi:fatty acid-binding protein DegV
VPVKRVRGSQKALDELVSRFVGDTADVPSLRVALAHGAAPDRLAALERLVREARPRSQIDAATTVGAVLGVHAGPGAVGLFWYDDGE